MFATSLNHPEDPSLPQNHSLQGRGLAAAPSRTAGPGSHPLPATHPLQPLLEAGAHLGPCTGSPSAWSTFSPSPLCFLLHFSLHLFLTVNHPRDEVLPGDTTENDSTLLLSSTHATSSAFFIFAVSPTCHIQHTVS